MTTPLSFAIVAGAATGAPISSRGAMLLRGLAMMRLSIVSALLSLAVLCAAVPAGAQQQWVGYRPAGAGYRVEFPGTPKPDAEDVQTKSGPIRMHMAEVQRGTDTVFLSIHSVHPASSLSADPQVTLDSARNGGVTNVKGKLREEKRLTVGGVPARRIVIDIPDEKQGAVALIVLSGNRLYQAISVFPAGRENSADVQRFLNSFALVPR